MKWPSPEARWEQRTKNVQKWHRWFAWHPVRIDNHTHWLEYVWRKGTLNWGGMYWKHKLTITEGERDGKPTNKNR